MLIAGAGIGGLTLALALAARGIASTIVERAPVLEAVGAGIQITSNAGHVLEALGLGDALDAVSARPDFVRLSDARSGRAIADIPLGQDFLRRFGAPYRVVHRGDLQAVLLEAAQRNPLISLHLGREVISVDVVAKSLSVCGAGSLSPPHPEEPFRQERRLEGCSRSLPSQLDHPSRRAYGAPQDEAEQGSGRVAEPRQTFTGRLLVGADGVRSAVASAAGLPPARHSGFTAWRAMIDNPDPGSAPRTGVHLSPIAHLVTYPVRGGRALNLVLIVEDGRQSADAGTDRPFEKNDWAAEPMNLLRRAENWLPWPLFTRPASLGWSGAMTLLGDAAHPVVPFLAQGAALAIEDAAVLADEFAKSPDDPEAAARRYELSRLNRWQRVQKAALQAGRIYHLSGPAALARDLTLRVLPPQRRLAPYDWVYAWRPPPQVGGTMK